MRDGEGEQGSRSRHPQAQVTSRDVARLAGVSQPTVSRALRGDARVSADTRRRVEEAAAALDYVPVESGRNLSSRATGRVAMVADLANPVYPHIVAPLHDELERNGLRMLLFTERGDEMPLYDKLFDRSVDGVVLTTTKLRSSLPYELNRRGVPLVMLNRTSDLVNTDSCSADNYGGAAQVARLFADRDLRSVAAVFGEPGTSTARDRERGFREQLAEAGIPLHADRISHSAFSYQAGYDAMRGLLDGGRRPEAVFCGSDAIAVGAFNAALDGGVSVPEDVALVGFDDLPMASWPCFSLTTVHTPLEEIAREAVRLLVARLRGDGPEGPVRRTFETSLILRRTHGD